MYELYPASTTDFAQPLLGDQQEVALFRPLLFHTRIEKAPLRYGSDVSVLFGPRLTPLLPVNFAERYGICQAGLPCRGAWLE